MSKSGPESTEAEKVGIIRTLRQSTIEKRKLVLSRPTKKSTARKIVPNLETRDSATDISNFNSNAKKIVNSTIATLCPASKKTFPRIILTKLTGEEIEIYCEKPEKPAAEKRLLNRKRIESATDEYASDELSDTPYNTAYPENVTRTPIAETELESGSEMEATNDDYFSRKKSPNMFL